MRWCPSRPGRKRRCAGCCGNSSTCRLSAKIEAGGRELRSRAALRLAHLSEPTRRASRIITRRSAPPPYGTVRAHGSHIEQRVLAFNQYGVPPLRGATDRMARILNGTEDLASILQGFSGRAV